MVLPLKPGKFYGSSLPRPRIYTDVKLSDERVDPPISVLDPLMSWATDAHWSMGGLSFNRLRLQGKIEGNVKKLKKERETSMKKKIHNSPPVSHSKKFGNLADSPPPAPISKKRRHRSKLVDEDVDVDDEEDRDEIEIESRKEVKKNDGLRKKRRLVRKLGDDFELVGSDNGSNERIPLKDLSNGGGSDGVALRTRSRRSMVLMDEEEEGDNEGKMSKGKKGVIKNVKAEKIKEKNVSESPSNRVSKKTEGKNSSLGSPNLSRSSPRLKQRSD